MSRGNRIINSVFGGSALALFFFVVTCMGTCDKEVFQITVFILALPAIGMIVWGFVKQKTNPKMLFGISAIIYILSISAGVYVLIFGGIGATRIFFKWLVMLFVAGYMFLLIFPAFDKIWQKVIVVFIILILSTYIWMERTHSVIIEVEDVRNVVRMDVFEGFTLPVEKKEFIRDYGPPENIEVVYRDQNDRRLRYEYLKYFREGGVLYVAFIDDDYENGYMKYVPQDLGATEFLQDVSITKKRPFKKYTIQIADKHGKKMDILVGRDNMVVSVVYFSDR